MPLTCANAERNTSRWLRRAIPVRFDECKRMLDMLTSAGSDRASAPGVGTSALRPVQTGI
jgi:hypothetical protein